MKLRPFALSNVRVVRLYQARCPCSWRSEIYEYAQRYRAEQAKRVHVDQHRRGVIQ